jgi:hypothetical protein
MRIPIKLFAEQEHVTTRYLYQESKVGRLTLTKVGRRTFVDDVDADAWRALAPKVKGGAGEIALQVAVQKLEHLGKVVAEGRLDRDHVVARLVAVAERAGLSLAT